MGESANISSGSSFRNVSNLLRMLLEPMYKQDRLFQLKMNRLTLEYTNDRQKMLEDLLFNAFGPSYVESMRQLIQTYLENPELYVDTEKWPEETIIGILASELVELHPTNDYKIRIKASI